MNFLRLDVCAISLSTVHSVQCFGDARGVLAGVFNG